MKSLIPIVAAGFIILSSCSGNNQETDAWGNFEATEILVSSQSGGPIVSFPVNEGANVLENDLIAVIDTTITKLKIAEIDASSASVKTRISTINSQNAILKQQISNLNKDLDRVREMLKDEAATEKQNDDIEGRIAVFEKQIAANNTQKQSVARELDVLQTKKEQLIEQLKRCSIHSPAKGTIINKYAEKGEITAAGKPLVKIAFLDIMKLKVYVSGSQLAEIKTGNSCKVMIDKGETDYYSYPGTITVISDKAEFTPKIIQTREERVSMVYAVTIEVANDGRIKSGMPGEVIFNSEE